MSVVGYFFWVRLNIDALDGGPDFRHSRKADITLPLFSTVVEFR